VGDATGGVRDDFHAGFFSFPLLHCGTFFFVHVSCMCVCVTFPIVGYVCVWAPEGVGILIFVFSVITPIHTHTIYGGVLIIVGVCVFSRKKSTGEKYIYLYIPGWVGPLTSI